MNQGNEELLNNVVIDLYADIVCPWCYIGTERLGQALAAMKGEVEAEVCYHPFFLDPSTPRDGISVPDKLRKKYGVDPKAMFERVESAARESGLALDLSRQPLMYPTQSAHTLLRHAHAKGTQPAFARALYEAYFQAGQNIADEAVLADVASRFSFTPEEALELLGCDNELELTREEARAAVENGIRGVPFYVFDGVLAVSGAQSVNVLRAAIGKALEASAASVPPPTLH
jgi:predicted DsbA family dithiol-disulfide isomerase